MKILSFITGLAIFGSCAVTQQPIRSDQPVLSEFPRQFLLEVNKLRASGCNCGNTYMPPAGEVTWNSQIAVAATNHARDMSEHNYFDHTNLSGKSVRQRLEVSGYLIPGKMRSYYVGENIARGQRTISEVMKGWIKSEAHCKNLMNKEFREIGVAKVEDYWVQDFGMRIFKN